MRHVPVLVVGGSLTGLSAAVFLAMHRVPVLVVERRADVLAHPRLRGLLPRAMELYRQAGLEPAITEVCPPGAPAHRLVSVHAETLAGPHRLLAEPTDDDAGDGDGTPERPSPCDFVPIGQHDLEALLVAHLRRSGTELCFGTELVHLEQDADGVTARLRGPGGTAETVRARYLVAADGASSGTRRQLGIGSTGPGTLFRMATLHLRADLGAALRGRPVGMAYLDRPAPGTTLGPLDGSGRRWFFATSVPPGDRPADPVGWVRAATGLPGLDVELLEQVPGADPVSTFPVGARVADRYAEGRVFLAGDAAHLMPPTGSLGGLTGVEDAHNLAWKLAWVLNGTAGPALLSTYQSERRPVAERNMRQAYARGRARWRLPGSGGAGEPILPGDTLMYGVRYVSAAVPGSAPGASPLVRRPRGTPGTRAPHLYVSQDADAAVSTLDLYGTCLVALVGPDGDPWAEAAHRAARNLSVPLEVYHLDEDLAAPHGLGARGALLVRPDGHVAWRTRGAAADPDREFTRAVRAVLAR
ncbi:FAD-dependent monooxygenase [Streptomyces pactum]|uniref:FAD-dependent monooxygenase n=1 Tax=Streptomyces pactum TaxID=68249 RepID=A0ABS0NE78_9ACTN|nr:FAD-dependent monooxygenase [Streptomyces pactum]MBH5333439.1 FAD-dependent monooxygenase [Streptomyces pactum]